MTEFGIEGFVRQQLIEAVPIPLGFSIGLTALVIYILKVQRWRENQEEKGRLNG